MEKTLFVIAHAVAQHHSDGVVGGWFDSALTDRGHAQAQQIASALRRLVPEDVQPHLVTSDLRRAVETAAPIAATFGVTPRCTADLREMSFGAAEGRPQDWYDSRFTPAPADNRLDFDYSIPGHETRRAFATRVYAVMNEILLNDDSHHIVVTHGGTVTFLIAAWLRLPLDALGWTAFRSTSGGITYLKDDSRFKNRTVVFVNHTDHLDAGAAS